MKCPYCRADSKIIDTRVRQTGTKWRRHVCPSCGQKFSSMEIYADDYKQLMHYYKHINQIIDGVTYGR